MTITKEEIDLRNTALAEYMDIEGEFERKRHRAGIIDTLHYHDDWLWIMEVLCKVQQEYKEKIRFQFQSMGEKWLCKLERSNDKGVRIAQYNRVDKDPIRAIWIVLSNFCMNNNRKINI
jgi:hypothetical protein